MKIHWHFENPWRAKAIYVPFEAIIKSAMRRGGYRSTVGDKFDVYLLEQPNGAIETGIRYGKEPHEYLSVYTDLETPREVLKTLANTFRLQWRPCRWDDENTRPTQPGTYFFRISGDSESDGAHVYYSYPDYTQTGRVVDDGEGGVHAYGDTDEEPESIIAWYGPITAPPCDCY